MENTSLASTTMDGTTILHMTRSFGSHAKSEFDKSLSCGFDMPSDSVRPHTPRSRQRRGCASSQRTTQPAAGSAASVPHASFATQKSYWCVLRRAPAIGRSQMRTTKKLTRASTNPSGSRKLEFDGSRGRSLTNEGLLELAMVLNEPHTNIEGLSLRYMKLSDEACAALADAIKVNWTLGRFELHGTRARQPVTRSRPPGCLVAFTWEFSEAHWALTDCRRCRRCGTQACRSLLRAARSLPTL